MALNYVLLSLVNITGLVSFDNMQCIVSVLQNQSCSFLIQEEEPCDVATIKEELTEEITVEECYVCFDR
jgi:hypothetical protein